MAREYRVVKATDREQKKHILVLWRDMTGLDPQLEREFLEAKIKEMKKNKMVIPLPRQSSPLIRFSND